MQEGPKRGRILCPEVNADRLQREKAKEGVHIQLLKVKSRIGIEVNEKADKLAHDACRPPYRH